MWHSLLIECAPSVTLSLPPLSALSQYLCLWKRLHEELFSFTFTQFPIILTVLFPEILSKPLAGRELVHF